MAYIGKCDCQQCGREVDAHTNVSGLGYYNCGPCGFQGRQRTQKGHRQWMETVRLDVDPDAAPQVPEVAPQKPAIRSETPEQKPAPEAKKRSGGLLQNSIFAGTR